jgi:hypothetical protein
MNTLKIYQHLLLIILAIVLLLQIPLQILPIFCILLPLLLISISIHLKNTKLGLVGIGLFTLLAIPQLTLQTMDDFLIIVLESTFLLLPTILLISQILQLDNKQRTLFSTEKKKPVLLAIVVLILILCLFYAVAILFQNGYLLSSASTEGQILLLCALAIITCIPFIQ